MLRSQALESHKMRRLTNWPDGRKFAFSIVDDTDKATVENTRGIYEFLLEHGLRTTKTIWPLSPWNEPRMGGATLEDKEYRQWILELQERGVEIGMHGTTDHTSARHDIIKGFNYFYEVMGEN